MVYRINTNIRMPRDDLTRVDIGKEGQGVGVYNLNQHYSKSLMTIAIVMGRGSGRGGIREEEKA